MIKKDYISAFVHLSPIVLDVLTLATGESESLPVLLGGVVHGQLGLLTEVASEANHVEVFLEKRSLTTLKMCSNGSGTRVSEKTIPQKI